MTIDRRTHGDDHRYALASSDDPSFIERLAGQVEAGPSGRTDRHVGRTPL